jgi:hypothetical protein
VKLGVVDQARLLKAAGTRNPRFAKQILNQLINSALPADGENPVDGEYLNGLLETLAALKPRDELEAMLMAQMLATNSAAAAFLRKTNHAATFEQLEVNSGITSRLLRTYALQLEALQRYRSKGKQKVTVRHVHVHAGAQAIVGDVHPGGTSRKTKGLHHAQAAADAPLAALRGPIQADGGGLQIPGNAERPLQDARREVARRPARQPACSETRVLELGSRQSAKGSSITNTVSHTHAGPSLTTPARNTMRGR